MKKIFFILLISLFTALPVNAEIVGEISVNASTRSSKIIGPVEIPLDGKFILTVKNPDASRDGHFRAYVMKTPYYVHWRYFLMEEGSFNTGWTTGDGVYYVPGGKVEIGKEQMTYEINAQQSWAKVWLLLSYVPGPAGTDNTGIDTMLVEYVPEAIYDEIPDSTYLTSITSGPREQNEVVTTFTAPTDGKLIIDATSKGHGGGGYGIYLNGHGLGQSNTGIWYQHGANEVTIAIPKGTHELKVRHEDPYYGDNSGTRAVDIYYKSTVADPIELAGGICQAISELDPANFKNNADKRKHALCNKIELVKDLINNKDYTTAKEKLINDIGGKMDGSFGKLGANDWITDSIGQGSVYPLVVNLVELLDSL